MTIGPRDIEKLRAIGYTWTPTEVSLHGRRVGDYIMGGKDPASAAKAHGQSPEGMKATMADKVRWLCEQRPRLLYFNANINGFKASETHESREETAASPEAAVDVLFWKVP